MRQVRNKLNQPQNKKFPTFDNFKGRIFCLYAFDYFRNCIVNINNAVENIIYFSLLRLCSYQRIKGLIHQRSVSFQRKIDSVFIKLTVFGMKA